MSSRRGWFIVVVGSVVSGILCMAIAGVAGSIVAAVILIIVVPCLVAEAVARRTSHPLKLRFAFFPAAVVSSLAGLFIAYMGIAMIVK